MNFLLKLLQSYIYLSISYISMSIDYEFNILVCSCGVSNKCKKISRMFFTFFIHVLKNNFYYISLLGIGTYQITKTGNKLNFGLNRAQFELSVSVYFFNLPFPLLILGYSPKDLYFPVPDLYS